jgi:hypothetical protein
MKTIEQLEQDLAELQTHILFIGDELSKLKTKPKVAESEFKVGDWVIGHNGCLPSVPKYVAEISDDVIRYSSNVSGVADNGQFPKYIRHATEEEIESYLRKVCDEKYVGKKVKGFADAQTGIINTTPAAQPYVDFLDRYWMSSNEGWYICVYEKGKFAEIVEEPKKKPLPKTKEELKSALIEFGLNYTDDATRGEVEEFINQYED